MSRKRYRWHGVCEVFGAMPIKFHTVRQHILVSTVAADLFGISANADAKPVNAMETHSICAATIGNAKREREIPNDLLTAIAQTESGRWDADREAVFAGRG